MVGGFSSILVVVAVLELNVVYLLEFFCRKIVKQELPTVKKKITYVFFFFLVNRCSLLVQHFTGF